MRALVLSVLAGCTIGAAAASMAAETAPTPPQPDLVKAANVPISDVFQLRVQNTYVPEFTGLRGTGNTVAIGVTMPLPKYRLIRFPQLSLVTIPAAITLSGGSTGFGHVRLLDIAVLDAGHGILWGVGPSLVFPSATEVAMGQGKWQAGPAVAIAYVPRRWLLGVLAQNPISFAGDRDRPDVNVLLLQPFATYQLGDGWFVRSQPLMVVNWKSGKQLIPLDLGVGRVFEIAGQHVSCFVAPFWNLTHEGPAPTYGVTLGATFLYPDFWRGSRGWDRRLGPTSPPPRRLGRIQMEHESSDPWSVPPVKTNARRPTSRTIEFRHRIVEAMMPSNRGRSAGRTMPFSTKRSTAGRSCS